MQQAINQKRASLAVVYIEDNPDTTFELSFREAAKVWEERQNDVRDKTEQNTAGVRGRVPEASDLGHSRYK